LEDLGTGALVEEPLWGQTWSRFLTLPKRTLQRYPRALPPINSPTFWQRYGEPLDDFLQAATLLRDAVRSLSEAKKDVQRRRGVSEMEQLRRGISEKDSASVRSWGVRKLNTLVSRVGPVFQVSGVGVVVEWDAPDSEYRQRSRNRGKEDRYEFFMRHRSPLMQADLHLSNTDLGLAFSAFAQPYARIDPSTFRDKVFATPNLQEIMGQTDQLPLA
jgi:hypothetical protein